jgi:P-loop ATPase protein family
MSQSVAGCRFLGHEQALHRHHHRPLRCRQVHALRAFEDVGYFCIDNLPPRTIPAAMETTAQGNEDPTAWFVVMDIRGRRWVSSRC